MSISCLVAPCRCSVAAVLLGDDDVDALAFEARNVGEPQAEVDHPELRR